MADGHCYGHYAARATFGWPLAERRHIFGLSALLSSLSLADAGYMIADENGPLYRCAKCFRAHSPPRAAIFTPCSPRRGKMLLRHTVSLARLQAAVSPPQDGTRAGQGDHYFRYGRLRFAAR